MSNLYRLLLALAVPSLLVYALGYAEKPHCPMPPIDKKEHLVGAGYNILAGKYWRTYDLDGDLREDYHVEYNISGVRPDRTLILSSFPSTYYLDLDHDGTYESIYVDMMGNGKCEDLRTYAGRETIR